ncbi:hypothetical protein Ga0100231_005395 [Opitutaceae bacterium TAV4]|nr:hypothetical protein Ga0100231_005395 [Opitutaceae bacterium TAV4]RRK02598.1 hypothetical protein Ga0100230_005645 [Opitutaceae bacterium TAV3]
MFGPSFFIAWGGVILAAITVPAVALRKISGGAMSWLAAFVFSILSCGVLFLIGEKGRKYDGKGQPVNPKLNQLIRPAGRYFAVGGSVLFAIGALWAWSRRKK